MWVKRDHKAEWAQWESWLDHIATSVKRVAGVTTKVQPAVGRSFQPHARTADPVGRSQTRNYRPGDRQDPARYRAAHRGRRRAPGNMASTVAIVPYQMIAGRRKDRRRPSLRAAVQAAEDRESPPPPSGQPATLAGQWDVQIEFVHGSANNTLVLEQDGAKLMGTHQGEFASGDLTGTVAANTVRFQSSLPTDGTRVSFQFSGTPRAAKCREPSPWASMAKPVGQPRNTSIVPAADAAVDTARPSYRVLIVP